MVRGVADREWGRQQRCSRRAAAEGGVGFKLGDGRGERGLLWRVAAAAAMLLGGDEHAQRGLLARLTLVLLWTGAGGVSRCHRLHCRLWRGSRWLQHWRGCHGSCSDPDQDLDGHQEDPHRHCDSACRRSAVAVAAADCRSPPLHFLRFRWWWPLLLLLLLLLLWSGESSEQQAQRERQERQGS